MLKSYEENLSDVIVNVEEDWGKYFSITLQEFAEHHVELREKTLLTPTQVKYKIKKGELTCISPDTVADADKIYMYISDKKICKQAACQFYKNAQLLFTFPWNGQLNTRNGRISFHPFQMEDIESVLKINVTATEKGRVIISDKSVKTSDCLISEGISVIEVNKGVIVNHAPAMRNLYYRNITPDQKDYANRQLMSSVLSSGDDVIDFALKHLNKEQA